jgi:hypothetical protein
MVKTFWTTQTGFRKLRVAAYGAQRRYFRSPVSALESLLRKRSC